MADVQTAPKFLPERYRAYLHLLARLRLRKASQGTIDASDFVQDALLRAHRYREQFRGQTEGEWRAWLRQILANVIADGYRKSPKANVVLEDLDQSASRLERFLPTIKSTPSQKVARAEQLLLVAEALAKLPDDERTALELRFFPDPPCSLADIAAHLKRPTPKAVAGLLARGLKRLRAVLDKPTLT